MTNGEFEVGDFFTDEYEEIIGIITHIFEKGYGYSWIGRTDHELHSYVDPKKPHDKEKFHQHNFFVSREGVLDILAKMSDNFENRRQQERIKEQSVFSEFLEEFVV